MLDSIRREIFWFLLVLSVGCSPVTNPAASGPAEAAASAEGAAPGKSAPGVEANCTAWAMVSDGPYRHNNNVWGRDKAKGKSEQCLLSRNVDGRVERGWTWQWPGFDPSVFAYPEIEFGWKPWSGGKSTDPRFPLRVADVKQLLLNYEVETNATGSFDLAPEIWLMKGKSSDAANPKLITTEVMFWMDYAEGARPAGKVIETPTFDGVSYELWKEDKIGESANGQGWMLLSFKSPHVQRKGTISIHTLLDYLVKKQLVNPEEYVASVEFGNEVMGGSGTTWVKRFDVEVGQ